MMSAMCSVLVNVAAIFCLIAVTCGQKAAVKRDQLTRDYWDRLGAEEVNQAVSIFDRLHRSRAKNVVLMIGDGMDLTTTVAGRIKIGQDRQLLGEEYSTALDELPHVGLAKTYSVDRQIPDSAATATAIMTGVKTRQKMIGVEGRVNGCYSSKRYKLKSVLHLAAEQGKSVGIVSTTRVQHATLAASYAHAPFRFWYSDDNMKRWHKMHGCRDISRQLYDLRDQIQVIMGGGRAHMIPSNRKTAGSSQPGMRTDGKDLIAMWQHEMRDRRGKYVYNRTGLLGLNVSDTDHLLGLFAHFDLEFEMSKPPRVPLRHSDDSDQPNIDEMTRVAIDILERNPKGYFLLVEGGLIDQAHHRGTAAYALEEFKQFERAVRTVRARTKERDTLLVVTADHGHTLSLGGKARRGNPILGTSMKRATDGKRHTTLLYGNGPGYQSGGRREPPAYSPKSQEWKQYRQDAAVPLFSESHSGEDTVVYASGPHAHLVHGVHEQSYVAHVMFYAACLGPNNADHPHCQTPVESEPTGRPTRT